MAAQQQVQAMIENKLMAVAQAVEDSVDEELHRLDKLTEDDLDALRAKRLEQMRNAARRKQQWLERGHGTYADVLDEKEFFAQMKGEERFVCHFYRSSNTPCKDEALTRAGQVMDKHLDTLAKLHLETKFCRIDAEKSPFLTERLKVWMLPTLALVKHEKVVDYVVGFDDLGGRDDFTTDQLRQRLAAAGLVVAEAAPAAPSAAAPHRALRSSAQREAGDEDSDFE